MGFVFDKKPTIEIDGRLYECDPTDINLIEGVSQNYPKILALGIEFEEMKKQLLDTRKNANMVAPKGSGTSLRTMFLEGRGLNSSYAVYQDAARMCL